MQLAKGRFAKSSGTSFYDAGYNTTNGVALGLYLADELSHTFCRFGVWTAYVIRLGYGQVVVLVSALETDVAHLLGVCLDGDSQLTESQFGKGSGNNATDGLASRRASAATVVADAVFLPVGEVGMTGTEHVAKVVVVVAVLILVADDEADGLTGRLALEHAAQHLHLVCFLASGSQSALTRLATVELALYELHIHVNTGRHTVYHAPNGRPMTLAERCQPKYMSKTVSHFNL